MPLNSPLMPVPMHFSISVTKNCWAVSAGVANSGTHTIGHAPIAKLLFFLVTELVKCDLFVAANLVTDKTHSSRMIFPAAPSTTIEKQLWL